MRDGGNTCTPVGSGAVDEQFWALVCEDEDWLDSEFDEIVSEPAESPTVPPPRLMVCADRSRPARQRPCRARPPRGTPAQYRAVSRAVLAAATLTALGREALTGKGF